MIRQGVREYGLSVEEAQELVKDSGLIVGELTNYFAVLGLEIDALDGLSESQIVGKVEAAHQRLFRESLSAGARPRPDGRTQEQWRTLLNQARDTLY